VPTAGNRYRGAGGSCANDGTSQFVDITGADDRSDARRIEL